MRLLARAPALLAPLLLAMPASTDAQGPIGLLVVAHGADSLWNQGVLETMAQVRWSEGPKATAFLMGPEASTRGWSDGVRSLVAQGAARIVVVPLMVSSAGAHFRQIEYYAGARDRLPPGLEAHDHVGTPPRPVPMEVAAALDDAPELGAVLAERIAVLAGRESPRAVMLVAHGPSSDEDARTWRNNLARAIGPLASSLNLRLGIGLLRDDAPASIRAAAVLDTRTQIERMHRETGDSVLVVPVLVSSGRIGRVTIPTDLADLPIRYTPAALTPSPALARWIERVGFERGTGGRLAGGDPGGLRGAEPYR
ncbi:MAG: CbiX/SirB N-terminal domain-containing protein [Gemmatimonadales bacterium]